MSKYRVIFEVVSPIGSGAKYYDDFRRTPICMPGDVNEEDWSKTISNSDDPWDQYNTLKRWAESGEHLIRNVRLYKVFETVEEIDKDGSRMEE